MTGRGLAVVKVVVLGAALSLAPAQAQETPGDIEGLIELARAEAVGEAPELPWVDLVAIVSEASDAQLWELVTALAPAEVDVLLAALPAGGAAPGVTADVVSAALSVDPAAADRLVAVVEQTTDPAMRPQIAERLFARIDRCDPEMPSTVHQAHVLAVLSLDRTLATRVVFRGNSCDDAFAAQLARILVDITETGDEALASAIETALALEGGEILRLASALRGELEVAAVPEATPPAVPAAPPAVPPAPIGGGGASPSGAAATTPGRDAIFFASGSSGEGAGSGPVFSSVSSTPAVSPVVSQTE
jgi:hypothetical protein